MSSETDRSVDSPADPEARSKRLTGAPFWAAFAMTVVALFITVNQMFNLGLGGFRPVSTGYYYLIIGLFGGLGFLAFPARKGETRVRWYDWLLTAAWLGSSIWLASRAQQIIDRGWNLEAPLEATLVAGLYVALALEALRRTGEFILFAFCIVFAAYPLYAGSMPGFLWGVQLDLAQTVTEHVYGLESIIGIPMQVVSDTLIGFIVFGVVLANTGGSSFFMNFASALMGRTRGGPAKVAIVSSGLFGMLSGSPTSNVLTTGTLTIPTMKRSGYDPVYAGAVEACASTGGCLMPGDQVPRLFATFVEGWYYIMALVGLTLLLLMWRMEGEAPFWISLFLLSVAVLRRKAIGFDFRAFCQLVVDTGQAVAQLVCLIAGIGLIIGAMSITGVANSFSRELVQYAGGNLALLLAAGAVTSFVLGMGMTASACYIFLAIVLAPALVQVGIDPMAAHLYIFYWGMVSFITPPVALAAIAAASIAKADAMRVGFKALRIGCLLLLLPVLFVLQPALILKGDTLLVIQSAATATMAVILLSAAFEGYLWRLGRLPVWARLGFGIGGLMLFVPEGLTDLMGLLLAVAAGIAALVGKRLTEGKVIR